MQQQDQHGRTIGRIARLAMLAILAITLAAYFADDASASDGCTGVYAEDGSCIEDPATYYGHDTSTSASTSYNAAMNPSPTRDVGVSPSGPGLGYGRSYWNAV